MVILSIYADQKAGYVSVEDQRGQSKTSKTSKTTFWSPGHTQSTDFLPLIQQVWNFSQPLSVLVVPRGPASFTTLRATLTMAKGIAFSVPRIEIFAPSQFHVLAFAARHQIQGQEPFFVLLDAFNQGGYGALMKFQKDTRCPFFLEQPIFLEKEALQSFFKSSSTKVLVTDLDLKSENILSVDFSSFSVIEPLSNFAEEQLELYYIRQGLIGRGPSEANPVDSDSDFDWKTLTPFYGHMPNFKKKNPDLPL